LISTTKQSKILYAVIERAAAKEKKDNKIIAIIFGYRAMKLYYYIYRDMKISTVFTQKIEIVIVIIIFADK
jgi:CRISPR/Cas system CSM-associated protein Csm2 small subunit